MYIYVHILPKLFFDNVGIKILGVIALDELAFWGASKPGTWALVLEHHRGGNVNARRLLCGVTCA